MFSGKDGATLIENILYSTGLREKAIEEIRTPNGNYTREMLDLIRNLLEEIDDIILLSATYIFQEQHEGRLLHLPIPMGSTFYYLVHVCEVDCPYCADPECDDAPANSIDKAKLSLGTIMFLEGWGKYCFATREEAEEALKGATRS